MFTPRIAVDVGIVVTNLERSLHFYRDLLALPAIAEIPTSRIGKGRMIQLRHGESLLKLIELDASPSNQSPKGISATFGYRYITLLVADLEAMLAKLVAAGVPIAMPITQLPNGAQIAMIADPDGNIIELVREGENLAT